MAKQLGWLKEEFKDDDHPFSASKHAAVAPPVSVDKSKFVIITLDQLTTSSCVVNAQAYLVHKNVTEQFFRQHGRMPTGTEVARILARRPQYYWTREITGDQHDDNGTFNRSAYDVLRHVGFAPEESCPFTDDYVDVRGRQTKIINIAPSYRVLLDAIDQRFNDNILETLKIRAPQNTDAFVVEVKQTIAAHGLQFGLPVDDPFVNGAGESGKVWEYNPDLYAGGHAMLADSFDEDGISGPQSWGGHHRFKIGWRTFKKYADDCWSINFAPSFFGDP